MKTSDHTAIHSHYIPQSSWIKTFTVIALATYLLLACVIAHRYVTIRQSEERAVDSVSRSMAALTQIPTSSSTPVEFTNIARYVTGLRTAEASSTPRNGDDQAIYVKSDSSAITMCVASHHGRSFCSRYDLKTKMTFHIAGSKDQQLVQVSSPHNKWRGWSL